MPETAQASVTALYRYPVKGLSPDPLSSVACKAGDVLPFDRAYAIENGPSRFDPAAPKYLPKTNFLTLMRDERLATLKTEFDEATETLTVLRDGSSVARGQLSDPTGRRIIEQFFSAYMNFSLRGAPKVLQAAAHSFSDVPVKCVHVVNLASVRELERAVGRTVDPLRFRANIYFDGDIEPWSELNWIDKELAIGDIRATVIDRTRRCEATNVNPDKGIRDMTIPTRLQRAWGHSDFGIYAKIASDGDLKVGDVLRVIEQ
ncbi:MAG: MOSC domain-containing protein [Hyphomicrobiaceae bacterium]